MSGEDMEVRNSLAARNSNEGLARLTESRPCYFAHVTQTIATPYR